MAACGSGPVARDLAAVTDSEPLIEIRDVVKQYGGAVPLRIQRFNVGRMDGIVLSGLDAAAAETFVHLVSGASVPDEGTVKVAGVDTRAIATDADWLTSLDQFGIVTHRAVFIEALPVSANMALPLTVAIHPMAATTRVEVERLARLVQLPDARLDVPINTLTVAERLRVHLARAFAPRPAILLLERPTMGLTESEEGAAFGRVLKEAASKSGCGFVALSDDGAFARESGATRLTLHAATGRVARTSRWWWR
jgi:ABC-type ATPase involved in cell division